MEAALVESETARRLEEHVAARVAEVVASEAVQQSLKARLARERKVGRASPGAVAPLTPCATPQQPVHGVHRTVTRCSLETSQRCAA